MNRSEVCLGVGAYDNNEWRLVKIGHWTEYACSVKSETIKLNRIVPLRCAWTSFRSEEMLGWILRVSLKYVSSVSGYDTSTRYRLDSLSIPGWLEIFWAGSVSGELRSWKRFSCAIGWKSFNMVDSLNIPNSFVTVVFGAPQIDSHQKIWTKLGGSGESGNTDLVRRYRYHMLGVLS